MIDGRLLNEFEISLLFITKAMGTTYRELFKLYDLIQSGDVRTVERFITENSLNLNEILPCKGIGVLHLAVGIEPLEKSRECTEIILKNGGDPNLSNEDGITPLHIAAIWGRVDNLKLLIGCGGDPSRRDLDRHSAFDYAAREQQWDVYDYLHNVVDQLDDSFASPCAYSLDLDKILVTTDQVVAEYEPIVDNQMWKSTECRKSEMVRDWCEKTSLVMNKLYPTILSDTFTIDSDPALWRSVNLTRNITPDLSTEIKSNECDETNITFKTCQSKKATPDIEISGIAHLEITADESKNTSLENPKCNIQKQRFSMYENFSLPCSPTSITHRNYNSKTSLKKSKNDSKESSKSNRGISDTSNSLVTDDQTQELDKALIVVQNRTNEWLSSSSRSSDCFISDVKACNTRRSSASSGVSSNFSGGSIVLGNVQEEYKYEDKEEDVVLIEKRLLIAPVVLPVDSSESGGDQTIMSVASSLPPSVEFDNQALRAELMRLGFNPGPIQDTNRTLYLKKLHTLKKTMGEHRGKIGTQCVQTKGKTYSIELEKSLHNTDWMSNLSPYIELESKARADFSDANKKWREGTMKTSFTYLLLDPRTTDNLPARAGKQSPQASWATFVNSIFYVGKGKRSRPYSHLYQALTLWKRDFTTSKDQKVQHILDIWSDKVGVVCLHIFQNVIPAEAYTYEAAMIDVLGLQNLKNQKSGNYYGAVSSWPLKYRRMLGLYLLYKAMNIFLSEGERQLRPYDID